MTERSGATNEPPGLQFDGEWKPGEPMERRIKASEFKATCLKLMDEVAETGKAVVITKNGVPVSRLVPHRKPPATLFGCLRGKVRITGDILSPLEDGWDEDRALALIMGEDPD